jgi:hypothetical protein
VEGGGWIFFVKKVKRQQKAQSSKLKAQRFCIFAPKYETIWHTEVG